MNAMDQGKQLPSFPIYTANQNWLNSSVQITEETHSRLYLRYRHLAGDHRRDQSLAPFYQEFYELS